MGRWRAEKSGDIDAGMLRVAVVRFPRISNSTDVDALAHEAGVSVQITTDPAVCATADLLVLPGSRSTVDDLRWLREQGIADVVARRAAAGAPVLGICGGYQMLARTIEDHHETRRGFEPGLGMLPVRVRFGPDKVLALPSGAWRGIATGGYEIHHGICELLEPGDEPFLDGIRVGSVWGTMWHGAFEGDAFRRAFLSEVARARDIAWQPDPRRAGYAAARETMIEHLADSLEEHTDVEAILALAR